MLLSNEFNNKYKDNLDMQNIMKNVDKATSDMENPLSTFEKEVLYETVYGFQKMRIEPYDLDIICTYNNLSYFNGVQYEECDNNYIYSAQHYIRNYEEEISSGIIVSDLSLENNNNLDYNNKFKLRTTLTHEYLHMFQPVNIDNINKTGYIGIQQTEINEMLTEKTTTDILNFLGYQIESNYMTMPINNDDTYRRMEVKYEAASYQDIVPMANLLHHSFAYEIYQEQYNGNSLFTDKINNLYGSQDVINQFEALLENVDNNRFDDKHSDCIIEAYAQCLDICLKENELTDILSKTEEQGYFLYDKDFTRINIAEELCSELRIELSKDLQQLDNDKSKDTDFEL